MPLTRSVLLTTALYMATACAAAAQQVPAKTTPAPAAGDEITTVTVTAAKPPVQNKIDRQVYNVADDPQAQSSSAADILGNVPAVTVDADGTVALRGNTGVQVYINGKPSAQMSADTRASTLQSMSADDIDSVEVMTSPSAAFGADSGGGIINIVLKKNRRLGPSGNINTSLGSEGRYNGTVSGSYNFGKLSLNGAMFVRHGSNKSITDSDRTRLNNGVSGQTLQHRVNSRQQDTTGVRGSLDYTLTDTDNVSLAANYSRNPQGGYSIDRSVQLDDTGATTRDFTRVSTPGGAQDNSGLDLNYTHTGKRDGETLKLGWRHSESVRDQQNDYLTTYALPANQAPTEYDNLRSARTVTDAFSGDYNLPLSDTSLLAAGWNIQHTSDESRNYQSLPRTPGATGVRDPNFTNEFNVDQTISAAYVTWQKQYGKFGLLTGLRYENMHQALHQITTQNDVARTYVSWSPSVNAVYDLSDTNKMRASYSHRVIRPQASLLNPFRIYGDSQNVSTGNPNLKPQQVDLFETRYEHSTRPFSYSASLYYQNTANTFTFGSIFVPGSDVLLTTTLNSGRSQKTGLDYAANGQAGTHFRYNVSGSFYYTHIDSIDLATQAPISRSGTTGSGRASLTYTTNKKDQFQIQTRIQGKAPTTQGSRSGFTTVDMSWQHPLSQKLRLTLNARDIFNSNKVISTTTNSVVDSYSERRQMGQTVTLGLSYTLGGQMRNTGDRRDMRGGGGRGGGSYSGGDSEF